jgi:hypothetical protein
MKVNKKNLFKSTIGRGNDNPFKNYESSESEEGDDVSSDEREKRVPKIFKPMIKKF